MRLRFALTLLALAVGLSVAVPVAATPTPKPKRLVISSTARAIVWSYPMPLPAGTSYGSETFTNPFVVARVVALVNAIPVSSYPKTQACPMDYILPDVIAFATSAHARPFAKVSFEFGGCPAATVYQRGVAETPTLGGFTLSTLYRAIVTVMSPHGQPLA